MTPPPTSPSGAPPPTADATPSAEPESAWIRDHLDAVYRFTRRLLSHEEAEDVSLEAFLALFEARAAGRGPQDPGAYLFGVARRRVADRLRRKARGRIPVPLPEGWEGFCDRPLAPQALADKELAAAVHVALGLLPAEARALLEARYREGCPVAELAARFSLSAKAVEMRLYRARDLLRGHLAAVGAAWSASGDAPAHGGSA